MNFLSWRITVRRQPVSWYVWLSCVCFICVLIGSGTQAQAQVSHQFHLYNNFSVSLNDVSGSGDNQSSLTEGSSFLNVLTLNGKGELNDFKYRYSVGAKATDDSRNDVQKFSLSRLQGRISNKIHTVTAGDTFESFSQYSLNTAVKGISYRYTDRGNDLPDVTVLYGIAYPRWDNFWGLDSVQRHVVGARLKQHFSDDFWLAASYVQSKDHDRLEGGSLFDTGNINRLLG